MKKLALLTLFVGLSFQLVQAQTTHIVDRNPNGIGDFDNLAAAITAASSGDILLLVPSSLSYGNLTLTSTGKRLTIAGGGFNGATGLVTKLDAISLNGGNANNTNLDGFVLGGFECKSIDVNFVDSVKIKAVKTTEVITSTNYQMRVRSSDGAEIEFVNTRNLFISGSSNVKVFHTITYDGLGIPALEIQTTNNFIVSNSFIRQADPAVNTASILFDDASTGIFTNNVWYHNGGYTRATNFGGAVNVVNNILVKANTWPNQAAVIQGGQNYQNNIVYNNAGIAYISNTTSAGILTLNGDGSKDDFGNSFVNPQIGVTTLENYTLILTDGSAAIDSGSGNDVDGTTADLGVFGGLDPMPKPMPNTAVGVSVVPSITNLRLSLPTAVQGGKVVLSVTGQSKKN